MDQSPPVLFLEWVWEVVCSIVVVLRVWTTFTVGTLISWIALARSMSAFKRRQAAAKKRGTEIILNIQLHRSRFLDRYFVFGSFFGEEEFYLVLIPIIVWNFDPDLGRGLNFVVCFGILIGNYIKDIFLVPRPPSPPVWVPKKASSTDSTALRDYGFPSTHSVNGVTNPAFFIMYYWRAGFISMRNPYWMLAIMLGGLVWFASLSFGRMYLGVHSPSDVEGGVFIGTCIMTVVYFFGSTIDQYVLESDTLWWQALLVLGTFLILSPQPRPRNPTFIQNALLCGLIIGAALGAHLFHTRVWMVDEHWDFALAPSWGRVAGPFTPVLGVLVRQVFGFSIVLALRQLVKTVLATLAYAVFGVRLGAKPRDAEEMTQKEGVSEDLVVGLEAAAKVTSYGILAWCILHGVPVLINNLNLDVM